MFGRLHMILLYNGAGVSNKLFVQIASTLEMKKLFSCPYYPWGNRHIKNAHKLNSAYNEVAFNEKSAIMKENLCTKYMPFTYKYIALNKKPPIMKQNLHIFFFFIGGVECNFLRTSIQKHNFSELVWDIKFI